MGKTARGSVQHKSNVDLLTPEQRDFLSGILGRTGDMAADTYQEFLSPQDMQQDFQTGIVDPMMQQYQQQMLPAIQQRFADAGAGSSSALNQALAASAQDMTTQMGGHYMNFLQQQQANRLGALSGLSGLAGQRTFEPLIHQRKGILGPLIGAAGQIGAGMMMSSRDVKENIEEYSEGLEELKKLQVKKYDYIDGEKGKIGLIAEEVPEEMQGEIDGVKAVDLYGLVGLLINSVKELSEKVEQLEATDAYTR